ncbi:MAG: hypothetical protein C3F13_08775 [Anaerolineales bacterium]|nr:hypothetical protein [Anaerolineae bacterium]PWB53499.1 MAG: hypothetical protein C3F13_08775 [Anaerolineales bacterium]
MDTMIDRYLAAVSDNLPAKQRKDTVTEIRSLIQDALEDRSKAEGRAPDDEMMAAVLKQFGPPEKIVAPYLPEKYLIGPRLFPTFMLVLRIALPIIAVLAMVGFWVGQSQAAFISGAELLADIIKSLGTALSAVVQAFGNIVLIFAILQWALPEFKLPAKEAEWEPHSLKAISQPDKIKRGELITEIIFTFLGLIIFNFYLDKVGIYNLVGGQWVMTPILEPAFNAYIPWFDLLWTLTIVLDVVLLRRNAWQTGSRLFSIVLSGLNIALAVSLMMNIPYLYTLQGALGMQGVEGILQSLLNQALIIVFGIVIIVSGVKIIQQVIRLVRPKPVLE